MMLPQWMYRQIITDDSVKAVWCFCGAPAISYCNGSQFVCYGGGHFSSCKSNGGSLFAHRNARVRQWF